MVGVRLRRRPAGWIGLLVVVGVALWLFGALAIAVLCAVVAVVLISSGLRAAGRVRVGLIAAGVVVAAVPVVGWIEVAAGTTGLLAG